MLRSLLVSASLLLTSAAFADETPMLVKTTGGGYMHPDFYRSTKCEIFVDKVVVTKSVAQSWQTREEKVLYTDRNALLQLSLKVEEASKAELVTEGPMIMDAPMTHWVAMHRGEEVLLKSVFSVLEGKPYETRKGEAAHSLVYLLDGLCD